MSKTDTTVNVNDIDYVENLYHNLSESDKCLIDTMMNMAYILLKGVKGRKGGYENEHHDD